MHKAGISVQKVAYTMIIIALTIFFLIAARFILVPLVFAILFAFMLLPTCNYFEDRLKNSTVAILISYLVFFIPVVTLGYFLIRFVISIVNELPSVQDKVGIGISSLVEWAQDHLDMGRQGTRAWINEQISHGLDQFGDIMLNSLTSSGYVITSIILVFIYTFLLLLYRVAIKQFFLVQFPPGRQEKARDLLYRTQFIVKKYFVGLLSVMAILGLLNSVGLWLIGVDYPFFFGFLAALLSIIPYVGTTLGGTIPFIYSLATAPSLFQPAMVVVLYTSVQFLEGNLITPKVVGSSVKINPLVAIIALLVGGAIWGIAGLILALPLVAILRIVFLQIDALKPVGLLLSSELMKKGTWFSQRFDEDRFRLASFFRADPPEQKDTEPDL